jgi:hypothetical protein
LAPAFFRSICRLEYDVNRRPSMTPESISTHGAWQIAATGFRAAKNDWTSARYPGYAAIGQDFVLRREQESVVPVWIGRAELDIP